MKSKGINQHDLSYVIKIGAGYGLALGAVETLLLLAGHGASVAAGRRAVVFAATLAADLAATVALALVFYGAALLAGKLIPAVKRRAAALAEIALVTVILTSNAVLIIRKEFLIRLGDTHPYKLAVFVGCGLVALAAATAWRALRTRVARKPVLISAAAAYVAVSAVVYVLPELKWAAHPKAHGPDVIFISLDTVRADHLGCYGYDRDASPNADAFAREAVFYANAICVQPTTNPSHVSMLTGLYPAEHGVVSNFIPMRSDAPTLPQLLAAHGYETAAVTGGFPLDRRLSNLGPGFRYYDDYINRWSYFRHTLVYGLAVAIDKKLYGTLRPAPAVTTAALDILDRRRDRPLFLFVHYFDPHHPYRYHGAAERFYGGAAPVDFEGRELELNRRWHKYGAGAPRPPFVAAVEALYDDEIFYTDRAVGDLLARLRRRDGYAETLVVVASDHGESFGEHGRKYHGGTVYDPETRVCLLIKPAAGGVRGRRVRTQVETLCLTYTVLAATGAPAEAYRGKRVDLLAVRDDPAAPAAVGFSQTNDRTTLADGSTVSRKYCVRTADKKLIFDIAARRYEYYDLAADAAETRNLVGHVDCAAYEQYRRDLARHIDEGALAAGGRVGGDLAEALRALGYAN